MSPRVSAIVVNHRSAAEAAACVASLRQAFASEDIAGEIVLVDCASGPDEVRALEALPADVRVFLDENRGYSGGVNAGLARAGSNRLLLSNADVVFGAGAVSELLAAHRGSARRGRRAALLLGRRRAAAAAGGIRPDASGELGWRPFRAPRRAARSRLWKDGGDARHLVGAVLAVRRDVFDRVGRFDERFLFEYEETEWEDRVRAAGLALRFVPRARVRHLYARSAIRNPETERRRSVSRRLYRERRWGGAGRWLIERRAARAPRASGFARLPEPALAARAGAWVAVSTNPGLVPFAGAPLTEDFRLPAEVLESLPPGPVYLRVFRESDGAPLESFVWEKA